MLQREHYWFVVVGGCGFLTEAVVLQLMLATGHGPIVARLVGFPLAVTLTWLLHRQFTFATRRSRARGRELTRYFATQTSTAVFGLALYTVLVLFAPPFARWPLAALVVAAAVGIVLNFVLSKFVVFTAARPPETVE